MIPDEKEHSDLIFEGSEVCNTDRCYDDIPSICFTETLFKR